MAKVGPGMVTELESGDDGAQYNGDFEVPTDTRIITDTGHSFDEIATGEAGGHVEFEDDEFAAKVAQQSGFKPDINEAPVEGDTRETEDFPADGGDDSDYVTKAKVITKEDVKGEDPKKADDATEEEVLPDRALVAPELAEFLKAEKPAEPSPLEERLARIEQALTAPQEGEEEGEVPAGLENKVDLLLQRIQEAEEREAERVASEQREARLRAYKEGVTENLRREKEKYPGLIKLGYEENVYNTLINELQAGRSASEDQIASKAEAELRTLFTTLKEVYEPEATTSKATKKSSPKKTPNKTLTQSLASGESTLDIGDLVAKHGPKVAAEIVWNRKQRNN